MHKLVLDGGEISAGAGKAVALQSVTLTGCVNAGQELKPGSACASLLEGKLIAFADPGLTVGQQLTLYRDDEKLGTYKLEKMTNASPGRVHFTAYDAVAALDKDLTGWLAGWDFPCTVREFARGVCEECALALVSQEFTNSEAVVQRFVGTYTGRQLMSFVAEVAGGFCRATVDGDIEIAFYSPRDITVLPEERLSFSRADYAVEAVTGINEGDNPYALVGNPLSQFVDKSRILSNFPENYVPCTFETALRSDICPGDLITVQTAGGSFTTAIMEKTDSGGRSRFSCTGSRRRTDASAQADKTASELLKSQSQADIFNKLTDFGALQGLYLQDGRLYINAELVHIVNLVAQVVESVLEGSSLRIDGAKLQLKSGGATTLELNNEGEGLPIVYLFDRQDGQVTHRCELTPHHLRLGGSTHQGLVKLDVTTGEPRLTLADGIPRRLYWQQTEDGCTLMGQ